MLLPSSFPARLFCLICLAVYPAATFGGFFPGLTGRAYATLASLPEIMVVGVIANEAAEHEGVALIRVGSSDKTQAVRVGQELVRHLKVQRITRQYVYFSTHEQVLAVRVGETWQAGAAALVSAAASVSGPIEIERKDNQVTISAQMRAHLVGQQLNTVLMQAAAVPFYESSRLKGFRLLEIEPGSIYDLAGFRNGDIIMAINGHPLTDVGVTIRLLQSMREETRAEVDYLRGGVEQRLDIKVQ